MSVWFGPSNVDAYVPPGNACGGHVFSEKTVKHPITGNFHPQVDCLRCEPHLKADRDWSTALRNVPLTAAEKEQLEAVKTQAAERQVAVSDALGRVLEKLVGGELPADTLPAGTLLAESVPPVPAKPAARRGRKPKTPEQA